jgi:hypothetical protein
MRITRETLLKIAKDTVTQQVRARHDLVSAFLIGSLLTEEPLLGGTTDIDLVFIHDRQPEVNREIIRLSPEISLDIAHHPQTDYNQPRRLRLNPWIGPAIRDSHIVFHDTQHWFEFTQASVTSQFYQPENVFGRASQGSERARQIWLGMQMAPGPEGRSLLDYLRALESASNAVASLTGAPLTERRFLVNFPDRARAIDQPGLNTGLLSLIGANQIEAGLIKSWLPAWQTAYQSLQGNDRAPIRLRPDRRLYYERAIETLLASETPSTALWPLMITWAEAIFYQTADSPLQAAWTDVCQHLHLDSAHFDEKLEALDAYLDTIEETLDSWAKSNGIS